MPFTQVLSWIQTREPLSAGFEGGSAGVMNRPVKQLLNNDKHLLERIVVLEGGQFINKSNSFFFEKTDSRKTLRLEGGVTVSLPQMFEEDDGVILKVVKVSEGTININSPFNYIQGCLLGQTLKNDVDTLAVITLEYVYSCNTWIILYKQGTWGV